MFENLKSILTRIIFLILFFVLAKSCVTDYINGGDQERIENLKQMIDDKTSVTAKLSQQYTETKIAGAIKYYKFDYNFDLNGNNYSGKIVLGEVPNTNEINLYYLKSNPDVVAFDPYKDLKSEEDKGTSITELLVGIVWAILAVLVLISLIKSFSKKSISDKKVEKVEKVVFSKVDFTSSENDEKTDELNSEIRKMSKEEREDHSRFMPK